MLLIFLFVFYQVFIYENEELKLGIIYTIPKKSKRAAQEVIFFFLALIYTQTSRSDLGGGNVISTYFFLVEAVQMLQFSADNGFLAGITAINIFF